MPSLAQQHRQHKKGSAWVIRMFSTDRAMVVLPLLKHNAHGMGFFRRCCCHVFGPSLALRVASELCGIRTHRQKNDRQTTTTTRSCVRISKTRFSPVDIVVVVDCFQPLCLAHRQPIVLSRSEQQQHRPQRDATPPTRPTEPHGRVLSLRLSVVLLFGWIYGKHVFTTNTRVRSERRVRLSLAHALRYAPGKHIVPAAAMRRKMQRRTHTHTHTQFFVLFSFSFSFCT